MADTAVAISAGTGTNIDTRTEGTNGNHRQVMVIGDPDTNAGVAPVDATNGLAVDVKGDGLTALQLIDDIVFTDDAAFTPGTSKLAVIGAQADETSTDSVDEGDAGALRMTLDRRLITAPFGYPFSVSVDITRPADTTAYAVNDALSDSTSAPTSGGFTLANVARTSGGSVLITDLYVSSSNDPGTPLQGDIFLFNTSVTNINDNTAFAVSDAEIKTCVAQIPFVLTDVGNNDFQHIQNLAIMATCSGSANLRFLVRVRNAYTPASGEVITVRASGFQID